MSFKQYFLCLEGTVAADIAGTSGGFKCPCKTAPESKECKEIQKKKLDESPVGVPGRTGYKDAINYITPELRAEFKRIVKKIGGKTVAQELLKTMNQNN
jgi:hypothetical protein